MIYNIGDNIISSLGFTTEENYNAVKQGISGVKHYEAGTFDLPESFMASLIDKEKLNTEFAKISSKTHYTDLEKAAILSVATANHKAQIDLSNEKTIFILSTTKGNVDLLDMRFEICDYPTSDIGNRTSDIGNRKSEIGNRTSEIGNRTSEIGHRKSEIRNRKSEIGHQKSEIGNRKSDNLTSHIHLWHTAHLLSDFFKNPNTPIVVSNACISGAAAQIVAMRELEMGNYDYAVVVGVDFLSKFIISGFQSFKALSPELCRPFDKDRCGLNLGEAAGTVIFEGVRGVKELGGVKELEGVKGVRGVRGVSLVAGAIRNDANHISAPSRTGEGSFRALKSVLSHLTSDNLTSHISHPTSQISKISFINAHGTSTPYNDAAEVAAIVRAGLEQIPVNSLKAFFGHTLGAAGVVESIISMRALEENMVLKSLNFAEQDFENQINVSKENHFSDKPYFIKMLSGFGGGNAALLFKGT